MYDHGLRCRANTKTWISPFQLLAIPLLWSYGNDSGTKGTTKSHIIKKVSRSMVPRHELPKRKSY